MAEPAISPGVRVDSVHWSELLPVARIFQSFRIAVDPPKLLTSLLLVVLLFLSGKLLDTIWGGQVRIDDRYHEIDEYTLRDRDAFRQRLAIVQQERQALRDAGREPPPLQGVFSAALRYQLESFSMLVTAATGLRFGLDGLAAGIGPADGTVVGALYRMFVILPGWLWNAHPGFLVTYVLIGLLLWSLLGGAIARMAGVQAASERRISPAEAVGYARQRWVWFFLAPLLPLILALLIVLVLAAGGLVLFNLPWIDILGGLLFGIALVLAVIAALLLLLMAAGVHLMYPALAIEGTDGFDAVSRAFNYVFGRPWRWLFYNLVALVYGAITYLFIGMVLFLSLWLVQRAVSWWVFADANPDTLPGVDRFEAMLTLPRLGELTYDVAWAELSSSAKIAAGLIWVWVALLLGLMPAYAISFYFAAHTWIYLLLRRSADGAELHELYAEAPPAVAAPTSPPPTEGSVESPPPAA